MHRGTKRKALATFAACLWMIASARNAPNVERKCVSADEYEQTVFTTEEAARAALGQEVPHEVR